MAERPDSERAEARARRVDLSINRLIAQFIPRDDSLDEEAAQQRHDEYYERIRQELQRPSSVPLSDHNHASDLIKRRLVQNNPSQALRYSNLYSRLLSLPVLDQKWAILSLLNQLADSPDPNDPDPAAYAEYQQEIAQERRRQLAHFDAHSPREAKSPAVRDSAPSAEEYRPTELKDVLRNPRERNVMDALPPRSSRNNPPTPDLGQAKPTDGEPVKRPVAIRSKMLADNYVEMEPSEPVLLRDLPFTLQGLSSSTLPFGTGYSIRIPPTLPPPLVGILHTLAEPSLLYRTLEDFVNNSTEGLLAQSLRAAIGNELRSYLTLIATIEGQVRRSLSSLDEDAPRSGIGKAGVTLKRCVVWTREATMGLRLMSLVAEESKKQKGGQLITLIHKFSASHGDPIVGAFAERLLTPVTHPFYNILRHWIYDGELTDPYLEFFVQERNRLPDQKTQAGSNVWEDKYHLEEKMIPSIITTDFAEKVFLIGKSLNFIRHSCGDAQWVESYSKQSSKELRYGDTATLEAWIDEAYKTTMRRLLHLMTEKFHLFEHLQALKDYILLGQGDFIALLMESLATNLDRPAGAQYRHTLTAQLEHAIRGSNAQYDSPEVLRRLDARMLQLSHGDIGWDCFTLEYKIDAPVDVVISTWGTRQYLKVFNFLWRVKRVEFALSSTWRKVTTGSRGVLQARHHLVQSTWKTSRGILAEMVHFVGQLQYYILFEVIESSWTELQNKIRSDDVTLDDIIKAHAKYLNSITHKGLLGVRRQRFANQNPSGAGGGAATSSKEDENSYMIQLGDMLRIMLAYRDCVDGLYSWSVSDFTRRQEAELLTTGGPTKRRPTATQRRAGQTSRGNDHAGDDEGDDEEVPGGPDSEFPALKDRLKHLGDRFRTKLQILLGDLLQQTDQDLRFLGVSMNFNDVYQPVKIKARSTPSVPAAGASTSAAHAANSAAAS
ncbi:Spc97/Spc98 family protein [Microdochium trichocladiopsis]|uniref:Spc97/Spc98 family protein n=1 Tax=Microdochium trichocladiopsis TaxID=1682393 RepID=A0A9P9BMI8_9PEZI|nr:Spc97/Spc98 family protein [Microdochium trichocladiopsis]KAH7025901.1 Spc97/Spc98 family protein [Microdochium trichocladiopsis]